MDAAAVSRLEALIAVGDDEDEDVLGLIKAAPGNVSLDTMLVEISKLEAIRAVGLPADLFAAIAPNVVAGWRARAMVESPSHLREHPQPTKLALLCALLYTREQEVTDTLAQLLISTVHRINAHAEEKVIAELVKDFKRVTGKETLLRKIAEASLGMPDDTVREVIYPVVGGEATLKDLVAEYRAQGDRVPAPEAQGLQGVLHQSLPPRADPAARRARVPLQQHRPPAGHRRAHLDRALRPQQRPVLPARRARRPGRRRRPGVGRDLLTATDSRGRTRIIRSVYEACVFQALRERLRCKEIWVVGAREWCNPDEDLPADFEIHRVENYDKLHLPLDATPFTDSSGKRCGGSSPR